MATLEINTNNEWLRVFSSLDFSEIPEYRQVDAADDFTNTLRRYLEDAGFTVERAKGQRSLCHGWNGANTFRHKIGPVGSFDELSGTDCFAIQIAIEAAEVDMQTHWRTDDQAE